MSGTISGGRISGPLSDAESQGGASPAPTSGASPSRREGRRRPICAPTNDGFRGGPMDFTTLVRTRRRVRGHKTEDRKRVGEGKSGSGRVDLGGWRIIKKKKQGAKSN